MTEALAGRGFDAIVDLLGRLATDASLAVMQAAVNTGIPRAIPSFFGPRLDRHDVTSLPFLSVKVPIRKDIEEKAAKGQITYTGINTGVFLDWSLDYNAFVNLSGKGKTPLYDGGDIPISASAHDDIGRAIAAVLSKPEETANKAVSVHSVVMTQNQVLGYARKAAPGVEFAVEPCDTKALVDSAWEEYNAGSRDFETMRKFAASGWFGMGNGLFERTDNEFLGIELWSDERLREEIARRLGEKPPAASEGAQ